MSAVRRPVLKSMLFHLTGSGYRKHTEWEEGKLQADEGDKENGDFLQFAEA